MPTTRIIPSAWSTLDKATTYSKYIICYLHPKTGAYYTFTSCEFFTGQQEAVAHFRAQRFTYQVARIMCTFRIIGLAFTLLD